MIIRREGEFLEFYRQVDHAAAAAAIAGHFGAPGFIKCAPYSSAADMIRLHDQAWDAVDETLEILPNGQPRDFMHMPAAAATAIWAQSIEMACQALGEIGGAVVSRHFTRLAHQTAYSNNRSTEEIILLQSFIERQERIRKEWEEAVVAGMAMGEVVIEEWSALLQAADTISVYQLVCGDCRPYLRIDPVALRKTRTPAVQFEFNWPAARQMTVRPWPFREMKIEYRVPCRVLPSCAFTSDEDLRAAYAAAPEEEREYMLLA